MVIGIIGAGASGMAAALAAAETENTRVILLERQARVGKKLSATGNGRLDAVANAIKSGLGIKFSDLTYEEHALTAGSSSKAVTYVSIKLPSGQKVWGVGVHDDIMASSVNALFSAVNRSISMK